MTTSTSSSRSTAKDFLRTVESRRAGDAGAGMHAGAAEPEPMDRGAIARQFRKRAHPERLVERKLGVVRLAFGPAFALLQILRREQLALMRRGVAPMLRQHREHRIAKLRAIDTIRGVLYMHLHAVLRIAARFDIRLPGYPPVLGIIVGTLEVVERRGEGKGDKTRGTVELDAQARGDAAAP